MGNEHVLEQLLGKTITGVVTKRASMPGSPQHQIFLLFSDQTYYEFYAVEDGVALTGGVDQGGPAEIRRYMKDRMQVTFEAYLAS